MAQKQAEIQHLEEQYAHREMMNKLVLLAGDGCPPDVKALASTIATRATPSSLSTSKLAQPQQLAEDCSRKSTYEMVLEQFTSLHANISTAATVREALNTRLKLAKETAYNKWIAAESTFRNSANDKRTAEAASQYAQGELTKYTAAAQAAAKHMSEEVLPLAKEKTQLSAQKQILSTIADLVKALPTASSADARAELLEEIRHHLQTVNENAGVLPRTGQHELKAFSKAHASLQATSTSSVDPATVAEALKILEHMTSDIATRLEEINKATSTAEAELKQSQDNKRHWEVELVKVASAADEAANNMREADLTRSSLEGVYTVAKQAYEDEEAAYGADKQQYASELQAVHAVVAKLKQVLGACSAKTAA